MWSFTAGIYHLASCLQGSPVSAQGSVSHFDSTLSNTPLDAQTTLSLCLHPVMDIRVVSTFWLSYTRTQVSVWTRALISLVYTPGSPIYWALLYLYTERFEELPASSSQVAASSPTPASSAGGLQCLHTSKNTCWSDLRIRAAPVSMRWNLTVV